MKPSAYNKWDRDRNPKKYDLLHPDEKAYMFRFYLREGFNDRSARSITINEELYESENLYLFNPETTTVLKMAEKLLEVLEGHYSYHSDIGKLKSLILFLKKHQSEDKQFWLVEKISSLQLTKQKIDAKIKHYKKELDDLKAVLKK